MKKIIYLLTSLSIITNLVLIGMKVLHDKNFKNTNKLLFLNNIDYITGYEKFKAEIKNENSDSEYNPKYSVIYCWDTLSYDLRYLHSIKSLDSISKVAKSYGISYYYLSEIDKAHCIHFLKKNKVIVKSQNVLGDMDDFISPSFRKCFPKNRTIGNQDTVHQRKHKPFYFILDNQGKILARGAGPNILEDNKFLKKLFHIQDSLNIKAIKH